MAEKIFSTNATLCYNDTPMKGDRLGEFEELMLLAVCVLREEAYGVPVQEYVERVTGRTITMGAVYASLDRLERKGFVRSALGDPSPERGGKRKRFFAATSIGIRTLREVRRVRDHIWQAIEANKS
jgi:DNA-binding PadR family transcriptional regulator